MFYFLKFFLERGQAELGLGSVMVQVKHFLQCRQAMGAPVQVPDANVPENIRTPEMRISFRFLAWMWLSPSHRHHMEIGSTPAAGGSLSLPVAKPFKMNR